MNFGSNKVNNNNNKTIAIITWDVTHNALGRAYMLAEALSYKYKVKIVGFTYKQKNLSIWEPLKEGNISVFSYPGENYPELASSLESLAPKIDVDIILVSKPRLPAMQLGLLIKASRNCPLLLDIDDYELGFFERKNKVFEKYDIKIPYGEHWTRFCESCINYADDIFVSNLALQEKYGGTIIPHARDENLFKPELYDKEERRKELGISPNDKVVLFLGTPREHKGLLALLETIKKCGNPNYKLCIIGTFHNLSLKERLEDIGGNQLLLHPDQPFNKVASNVAAADLVCILQNQESEVSKYQFPAKVVDAMAMGVPVLAYNTPPLQPLIEQDVVIPTRPDALEVDIMRVLSDIEHFKQKQLEKRDVFLSQYSYGAILRKMDAVINKAYHNNNPLPAKALSFTKMQTNLLDDVEKLLETEGKKSKRIKQNWELKLNKMEIEKYKVEVARMQEKLGKQREHNSLIKEILGHKESKLRDIKNNNSELINECEIFEKKRDAIMKSRTWRYILPLGKSLSKIKGK